MLPVEYLNDPIYFANDDDDGVVYGLYFPGPNIAYFGKISSLEEMVGHIYGRLSLLKGMERPHMFIEELKIYVNYLRGEAEKYFLEISARQPKYFQEFRENLLQGIEYYRQLAGQFIEEEVPNLVVVCPSCTMYSQLQNISMHRVSEEDWVRRLSEAGRLPEFGVG